VVEEDLAPHFQDAFSAGLHGFTALPFFLVLAGAVLAWFLYLLKPELPGRIGERFAGLHRVLLNKYGFDIFYQKFFAGGARELGQGLWKYADAGLIDGVMVNGSAALVGWAASVVRRLQSGYLYQYAFAMILGLLGLLTWFTVR
jgi:NADH-quinone oxidoreductase subunit L